jgi:hypothetical protein
MYEKRGLGCTSCPSGRICTATAGRGREKRKTGMNDLYEYHSMSCPSGRMHREGNPLHNRMSCSLFSVSTNPNQYTTMPGPYL